MAYCYTTSLRRSNKLNLYNFYSLKDGVEFRISSSSSFISGNISSNNRLDKYRSAVSANMHNIVDPLGALFATSMATAKVEPPEIPVRIPSLAASFCDHLMPSIPATGIISSINCLSIASCKTRGMKSVVHP